MAIEGLLLVDKPSGWTSHDVVAAIRGRLPRGTKVGHSGTLDPLATGLLVLLIGPATRQAARLQGLPKTYSGRLRLGVETDTADLEGRVLQERPVPTLSGAEIQALFDRYLGRHELPPPAYSAVKHKGRPLYAYARDGVAVPIADRPQVVYSWRLLDWTSPEASFRLECAGGTYVRSLAVAVGRDAGCGATLSALRRDAVGPLVVDGATGAEEAKRLRIEEIAARLIPVPDIAPHETPHPDAAATDVAACPNDQREAKSKLPRGEGA